ncbi:MAG: hypothetical protein ABH849_03345 [Nanoarchaeota archaeon]
MVELKGILETCRAVDGLTEKLAANAAELGPEVLAHFNTYVDESIRPALPEGYTINESTLAKFSQDELGYTIWLGIISDTDGNMVRGYWGFPEGGFPNEISDLCKAYVRNTSWVKAISLGLKLA